MEGSGGANTDDCRVNRWLYDYRDYRDYMGYIGGNMGIMEKKMETTIVYLGSTSVCGGGLILHNRDPGGDQEDPGFGDSP